MDWQPEAEVLLPHQAERATFTNNASDSTPALEKGLSSDVFGIGIKGRKISAPPAAPLAMRIFGGNGFDDGSAQRMERAMNMDKHCSAPRSFRYVVPTLVTS